MRCSQVVAQDASAVSVAFVTASDYSRGGGSTVTPIQFVSNTLHLVWWKIFLLVYFDQCDTF